jgi:predicted regulator of Ras-like GTPase activity (Roadblock/LC7/MglB family)
MSGDDIHAMSETLAKDPSSLVFLPLAEALLMRGDLARAARVASRGAQRHPARLEAHDLVARVALAMGDEPRAEESWGDVLRIDATFGTAHRGIGLLRYRQGRLDEARDHLAYAAHQDPGDNVVRAALEAVHGVIAQRDAAGSLAPTSQPAASPDMILDDAVASAEAAAGITPVNAEPGPRASAYVAHPSARRASDPVAPADEAVGHDPHGDEPARLFDHVLEDSKQVALLLDSDGLVAAGSYVTGEGRDLGNELGAHLSGVGEEAERAMRHFKLGLWHRMVIETEAATIEMAPTDKGAVLIAAAKEVPLGFVRRTLERCLAVARQWLGEG